MTEPTYLFGVVAVLAGALASISIWAPRRLALKLLAVGGATLFLLTARAGFAQLLALPKPVGLEWWQANAQEATVLAASLREDQAIYLWLQLKDVPEPRARTACPGIAISPSSSRPRSARRRRYQTQVQMRLPFEASLDDREPGNSTPCPTRRCPARTMLRHRRRSTTVRPSTTPERRRHASSAAPLHSASGTAQRPRGSATLRWRRGCHRAQFHHRGRARSDQARRGPIAAGAQSAICWGIDLPVHQRPVRPRSRDCVCGEATHHQIARLRAARRRRQQSPRRGTISGGSARSPARLAAASSLTSGKRRAPLHPPCGRAVAFGRHRTSGAPLCPPCRRLVAFR